MESAPDAVAIEAGQEVADNDAEAVEREVGRPRHGADDGTLLSGCLLRQSMRAAEGSKRSAAPCLRRLRTVPARVAGVMRAILGDPRHRSELCWNLGDAVIRRRSVLACW